MDIIVDKYYVGYEGEPEEKGWSSLAYYYHLDSGWYEESPWLLQDINAAIEQLKSIKKDKLSASRGSINVLIEIIKVLEDSVISGDNILIAYE